MGLCSNASQPADPKMYNGPTTKPTTIISHQQEEKKAEEMVKQEGARDIDNMGTKNITAMDPTVANEKMEHSQKETDDLMAERRAQIAELKQTNEDYLWVNKLNQEEMKEEKSVA